MNAATARPTCAAENAALSRSPRYEEGLGAEGDRRGRKTRDIGEESKFGASTAAVARGASLGADSHSIGGPVPELGLAATSPALRCPGCGLLTPGAANASTGYMEICDCPF